jgi:hypothetical protein
MKFYFFEAYTHTSKGETISVGHIAGAVSRLNAYNILRRRFGKRFSTLISLYEVSSIQNLGCKQFLITAQKTAPQGVIRGM